MAINHFKWFASEPLANVMDQMSYEADGATADGYPSGLLPSQKLNKSIRQGTAGMAILGQLMHQVLQTDINDDGNLNPLTVQLWNMLMSKGYFIDHGGANAIQVVAPTGYAFPVPVPGQMINVKIAATNTQTGVTLNWMGGASYQVVYSDYTPILPGDFPANGIVTLVFDGVSDWQCVSFSVEAARSHIGQITLLANQEYWVATTGSDSNSGSSAFPWLTLAHAATTISRLNTNNFVVVVHVAPGLYNNDSFRIPGVFGGGSVQLQASDGTPANTVINTTDSGPCIQIYGSGGLFIQNFKLQSSGATAPSRYGIQAQQGGNCSFNNMDFGACTDAHFGCFAGGLVSNQFNNKTWNVSGATAHHGFVDTGGNVNTQNCTVTFSAGVNFISFAAARGSGAWAAAPMTFGGAGLGGVTGPRYSCQYGGVIYTSGGGPNYFPGNSAGDATTGYYS